MQKKLNKVINSINSNEGKIIDKKVTTSKEYAPKLFSLTSLQGYITSKYSNFTSDKVLSVCQSLYEGSGKGGYITYPRTDSIYLEESLASKVSQTLDKLKVGLEYENKIKFTKTYFKPSTVSSPPDVFSSLQEPSKARVTLLRPGKSQKTSRNRHSVLMYRRKRSLLQL